MIVDNFIKELKVFLPYKGLGKRSWEWEKAIGSAEKSTLDP